MFPPSNHLHKYNIIQEHNGCVDVCANRIELHVNVHQFTQCEIVKDVESWMKRKFFLNTDKTEIQMLDTVQLTGDYQGLFWHCVDFNITQDSFIISQLCLSVTEMGLK